MPTFYNANTSTKSANPDTDKNIDEPSLSKKVEDLSTFIFSPSSA